MESPGGDHSVPLQSPLKKPRLLGVLLGLGLFVRLGYGLHLPHVLLFPDENSFDKIAWSVASQGQYAIDGRPTTYRPPSYVIFMAALYKIFGHHYRVVRAAQAFMGLGLVLVLIGIANELRWSVKTQWAVACLTTFYPFFIYYESHLMSDASLTFWHAAALLSIVRWHLDPTSEGRAALVGFCFAVLCLMKGIFIPLFAFVIAMEAFLAWRAKSGPFPWRSFMAAGFVFALPLFLWALRNERTFGRFMLDGHGGSTMIETIVFHDRVKDGTYPEVWAHHPLRQKTEAMSESDRDAFYSSYVKNYVRQHPRLYALQSLERFKDLWRFYPRQDIQFREGRRSLTLMSLLTEPFLILAGLVGLFRARRRWRELYPFYATLFLTTAAYALITGQMRYRLPLMPIMILFASYAVFTPKNRSSDH